MGQGKLEIFLENTLGMKPAEVSNTLWRFLRGNQASAHGHKAAEFRPWAQAQVLLLGKGLLYPLDIPGALCSPIPLHFSLAIKPLCILKRLCPGNLSLCPSLCGHSTQEAYVLHNCPVGVPEV